MILIKNYLFSESPKQDAIKFEDFPTGKDNNNNIGLLLKAAFEGLKNINS